ncbi:MAG: acetyl-CoA carboxylase biotin carboxyl carrier protein [Lachnotalea sp.]
MDISQIEKLVKILEDSSLTELAVKDGKIEITLKKEKTFVLNSNIEGISAASSSNSAVSSSQSADNCVNHSEDGTELYLSPMVGIFYPSASEESNHYVKVGDTIKKGQPLCIIEAMKMMNEISSDFDMQIVEILAGSEEKVEYDQPLFKIKKIFHE